MLYIFKNLPVRLIFVKKVGMIFFVLWQIEYLLEFVFSNVVNTRSSLITTKRHFAQNAQTDKCLEFWSESG